MEAVKHDSEIVAVRITNDVPRSCPVPDVATPGERLVSDDHALLAGDFRKFGQVVCGPRRVVDRLRQHVRTQTEEANGEFVHELHLASRPLEIAMTNGIRHGLEIAQRLKRDDFNAEVGRHASHVPRLAFEERQIVLEQFHRAKARFCGGGQLAFKRSTHADGGD